ncbi:2-C-methyl-D-erythritol 2,4-cyclodiphosphate synthase [Clostridia bacterium]|nr:2-C-methyl-D-erythritol 2,4-cyclodiphosphate synthase [Clostridia bacterium]
MRVGIGYDVHQLNENRKLILGGVHIPHNKGLAGHSDADVLLHAIMDALLGAAALGDIGQHFPDTNQQYASISSLILLEQVKQLLDKEFYIIGNIDATIIAQNPKLATFIPQMRKNIAQTLSLFERQINIKATTEEHLGFTGREEGMSAQAIVCLYEIENYLYNEEEQVEKGCGKCCGCSKKSEH